MIVVLLAVMLRIFVPFEFSYTKSIWIKNVLSSFRKILTYPILINSNEVRIWHILVMMWGISATWGLMQKICLYRRITRYVSLLPQQQWNIVLHEYGLESELYERVEKTKLVYSNRFTSPCLIGLKHPYIVLPEILYEKEQFRYIILHELIHVHKKDIGWKVLIDLLCTVFWWNPVFRYLRKELFLLIEIRNDIIITAELSEKEKTDYMVCLKDVALQLAGREITFGVSFGRSSYKELKRRMEMIAEEIHLCRFYQVVLCILVGVLLFISSAVVIEPYRLAETEEGVIMLMPGDMYLVENGNQYDVYVFGQYTMTVDREDLKYFQNVIVYKRIEDVQEVEKIKEDMQ